MITKAAVKIFDIKQNKEVILPVHRHADAFAILYNLGYKRNIDYTEIAQGFLDEDGVFLNRHLAWLDAVHSNQLLIVDNSCRELYSEDIY